MRLIRHAQSDGQDQPQRDRGSHGRFGHGSGGKRREDEDVMQATRQPLPRSQPRLRETVYLHLKKLILLNELKPNTPLTELGIAESMGCSQGTVREALLLLQEDGLVLRSGHRGTTVTPLDAGTAEEMLALRRMIETRAARRAAALIDAGMLGELDMLQTEMDRNAADNNEFGVIESDIRFHMALFQVAGHRALEQILKRVILHTHRQKLWEPRHRRPLAETAGRHRQILAAIPLGGEALAAALGQHIDTIVDIAPERIAS